MIVTDQFVFIHLHKSGGISEPDPMFRAMGRSPKTVVSMVMSMGLILVLPASRRA